MQDAQSDVEIGPGGWVLVVVAGAATFGVLRLVLGYDLFPAAVFALAIALVVVLLLFRLAAAIGRMDDEEAAAQRVRKIVPAAASAEGGYRSGGGEGGAVVAARIAPSRPGSALAGPGTSALVTPLSEVESAPLIAPPPVYAAPASDPVAVAMGGASERAAPPVPPAPQAPKSGPAAKTTAAAKSAKPKAAAKPAPETKPKAEPKPKPAAAPPKPAAAPKAAAPAPKAAAGKPKAGTTGWTTKPGTKLPNETGPKRLSAPRGGRADDLKLINGIGPKLEALCNRLGIYHFDQIAAWTPAEVFWADDNLEGFKGRVSRDNWVAQARVLAAGGSAEEAARAAKA
jgi:NADH-quinone oxidoreductase subunit E